MKQAQINFANYVELNNIIDEEVDSQILTILEGNPEFIEETKGLGPYKIFRREDASRSGGWMFVAQFENHFLPVSRNKAIKAARGAKISTPQTVNVNAAARTAIRVQIADFKSLHITNHDDQVDHNKINFATIFQNFCTINHIILKDIKTRRNFSINYGSGREFVDTKLWEQWQNYHREHAILQVVSLKDHKELTKSRNILARKMRASVTKN